jgi:hypothetical protein
VASWTVKLIKDAFPGHLLIETHNTV